jgi:hypothetical protein
LEVGLQQASFLRLQPQLNFWNIGFLRLKSSDCSLFVKPKILDSCLLQPASACFSLLHASAGINNIAQRMSMPFPRKRESRRFGLHKCPKEVFSSG